MEGFFFKPADYERFEEMFTKSQEIIQEQAKMLTNAKIAWVNLKQACEITGYGEQTLLKKKTEIGYRTMGKDIFFKLSDLDKWMEKYYRAPRIRK